MKAALPVVIVLLACSQAPAEVISGCLPAEAGKVVSRLVESGKIGELVPDDWTMESANIELSRLVVTFRTGAGIRLGIVMQGAGHATGKGRWFSHEFFHLAGPPLESNLQALGRVASLIDGSFDSSPWVRCLEAPGDHAEPAGKMDPAGGRPAGLAAPKWLHLILGTAWLAILLWGLFSALWNRTPPPTRSEP
jgi:hypothetical protein